MEPQPPLRVASTAGASPVAPGTPCPRPDKPQSPPSPPPHRPWCTTGRTRPGGTGPAPTCATPSRKWTCTPSLSSLGRSGCETRHSLSGSIAGNGQPVSACKGIGSLDASSYSKLNDVRVAVTFIPRNTSGSASCSTRRRRCVRCSAPRSGRSVYPPRPG